MSDRQQWNEDFGQDADGEEQAVPRAPGAPPQGPTQIVGQVPPPLNQPPPAAPGSPQYRPPTQAHYQPPTQAVYQQPPGQPQQPPTQPPYQEQYSAQPGQQQYYAQPGQQVVSRGGFTDSIRRNGGRLGIVAAVVLIGAAGAFALWRAFSETGGAATPAEAAAMFFSALNEEDALAVAEIALPSEREAVLEPSTAVLVELARLDLLDDAAIDDDGNPIGLFGLQFDIPAEGEPGALVYEVEPVGSREDIQWVTVSDGTIELTYDPQEIQDSFGGRLRDWVEQENANADLSVQTETIDLGEEFQNGTPLEFAVVDEGGRYYVSWTYTVAGLANDKQVPAFDQAPAPVGSDSPEQAAIDLLDNLVDLDATGVMTMLDPQEFRAAYDYWGSFGPDLARAWDEAKASAAGEGVTWDLVSAQASAQDRNGRKVVSFDEVVLAVTSTNPDLPLDLTVTANGDGLTVAGTVQGSPAELIANGQHISGSFTIDGQSVAGDLDLATYEGWYELDGTRVTIQRDGDCLVLTSGPDSERVCDEELALNGAGGLFDVQDDYRSAFAEVGRPGLTVVERDGRWYVSGLPTVTYTAVDILRALDAEELDRLIDNYQQLLENGVDQIN